VYDRRRKPKALWEGKARKRKTGAPHANIEGNIRGKPRQEEKKMLEGKEVEKRTVRSEKTAGQETYHHTKLSQLALETTEMAEEGEKTNLSNAIRPTQPTKKKRESQRWERKKVSKGARSRRGRPDVKFQPGKGRTKGGREAQKHSKPKRPNGTKNETRHRVVARIPAINRVMGPANKPL